MMDISVDVRHAGKTYINKHDQQHILRDISFTCSRGSFVSLIGPSGCGKTTLLRCLAGLEDISEGEAYIDGTRVCGPGDNRAMVFQEPRLFPWMTVEDNVAVGLTGRMPPAEIKAIVEEQLALIRLESYAKAYPRQLSGGMAQRVALARALAFQAPVLLLDEPFSALDIRTRGRLQEDVLTLWQETEKTILLVTHDIGEALLFSQRVLTLGGPPPDQGGPPPNQGGRPSRIAHEVTVDLPYPRNPDTPEFIALRRKISAGLEEMV